MMHVDTVDRTIRNRRYHDWPVVVWLGGWFVFWMGVSLLVDRWMGPPPFWPVPPIAVLFMAVPVVGSFMAIVAWIDRRPISRLKLGEELSARPVGRVKPNDIAGFRFARDPYEDYVESRLPIPVCELTIEARKRSLKMIVSLGDAARVREWAEKMGVAVIDPAGYSTHLLRNDPS
jgi:hypothetical protein